MIVCGRNELNSTHRPPEAETAVVPSRARQQFQFSYDGRPLQLDVAALPNTVIPSIQLYVSSEFQESYK